MFLARETLQPTKPGTHRVLRPLKEVGYTAACSRDRSTAMQIGFEGREPEIPCGLHSVCVLSQQ